MITTVVFDIGNVLIPFTPEKYMRDMGISTDGIALLKNALFQHEDWCELDRGVLTEEEILNRFKKRVPAYADDIKNIIYGIYRTIRSFDYTRPWIMDLKSNGYRVYYLSNYGSFTRELSHETLAFTELMDGGLFSYEVQMIKPNPWIFAEFCKRFDVNPQEAVFLDDSAANIAAAKEMGFSTIHFTSYEDAAEKLKNMGVH